MDRRIYVLHRIGIAIVVCCVVFGIAAVEVWQRTHEQTQLTVTQEHNPDTSLLAVGDIMLSRAVGESIVRNGVDYPFAQIQDKVSKADIAFGNLEAPITDGAPSSEDQMVFHSAVGVEKGIANAGFDVLSLANNHTTNFGSSGLLRTIQLLQDADIGFAGAGTSSQAHTPFMITRNGITFAFLAYVDGGLLHDDDAASEAHAGVAFMDIPTMQHDVAAAKQQADVVIVSMHAGVEYDDEVTDTQTAFAHAAIDAGAELALGSHPHVVQPVEQYNGKMILYSLGNCVFDQQFSGTTSESVLATVHFDGPHVYAVTFDPIIIDNSLQPRIVSPDHDGVFTDSAAQEVLQRLGDAVQLNGTVTWDAAAKLYSMNVKATTEVAAVVTPTPALDSKNTYTYVLQDGQLTVNKNGVHYWQSPNEWWVNQYAVGPVTGHSTATDAQQLTMSVWKPGNFGESKPFWVTENDPSIKNHFFVFSFGADTLKAVWQSSNLERPNCDYALIDMDGDGQDELVTTEGTYGDGRTCDATNVAVWKWNEWGFENEWRSGAGVYTDLRSGQEHTAVVNASAE